MGIKNIYKSFIKIYTNLKYILITAVISIVYYFMIIYLIRFQNENILLLNVPIYMIYILSVVSAVLITVSIYSIINTVKNKFQYSGISIGTIIAILGGIITGCGCSAPILFGLVFVGVSTSSVILLTNFISNTAVYLFLVIISINITIVIYYLNRIGNPLCKLKK